MVGPAGNLPNLVPGKPFRLGVRESAKFKTFRTCCTAAAEARTKDATVLTKVL